MSLNTVKFVQIVLEVTGKFSVLNSLLELYCIHFFHVREILLLKQGVIIDRYRYHRLY